MRFIDKRYNQTIIILLIGLAITVWMIINLPDKWEAGWKYFALIVFTLIGYIALIK